METIFNRLKKYNPWQNNKINNGFERKFYVDKISQYFGNKLVKVLVGQRRAGKSYILRQIINYLIQEKSVNPQNIFFLNKEYIVFDDISSFKDLETLFSYYLEHIKPEGKVYIFLDEVQNIQSWEKFANSYSQDFTESYEIFITGSNSNLLSGELASLLSGRYVEFEIYPFSFSEYTQYLKIPENKESLVKYLSEGGMPEMFNFKKEEIERHYIESLKNTIILRDIIERHKVMDVNLLEDVFKYLTVNIGNITSISNIVKYFKSRQKKTNYETISSYVSHLLNSYIIHEAERYNLRGKQILGGVRKYYLNDLSFKNYLYGFLPTDIGYNLENYIYLELRRRGYRVNVGVLNDKEIDFTVVNGKKTIYVQAAYLLNDQATVKREFGNLLEINDNYEKYVISMDDVKFSDFEGVKHIRAWEMSEINYL